MRVLFKLTGLILASLLAAPTALAGAPPTVFVSIAPQKHFVQQICKNMVTVKVMAPSGASPATYEPKPAQMAALSNAAAYFAIGVPFEKNWLPKFAAANPDMKIVHTDKGVEKMPMASAHEHAHGGLGAEHDGPPPRAADGDRRDEHRGESGIADPHIWLSPPLVVKQAENILEAMKQVDPENSAFYEENHRSFVTRIRALDADLKAIFSGKQGLRFMVFHPSWGYFARAYGLVQVPAEIEGKEPKPAQLRELIELARQLGVRVIFAQPQFSSRSAELISGEIGGRVVFVDPLAPDWSENLRRVAGQIESALK